MLFEMSTEVVIGVNVWWRVKDVVVSGCLGVLEDTGEEFCCESEATIMKRGYAERIGVSTWKLKVRSSCCSI